MVPTTTRPMTKFSFFNAGLLVGKAAQATSPWADVKS